MIYRPSWAGPSRRLPREVFRSWQAAAVSTGMRARALAWAEALDGWCVGADTMLSMGAVRGHGAGGAGGAVGEDGADAETPGVGAAAPAWTHVGWHEIEQGGWNVETRRLSWVTYDRQHASTVLDTPGRLPELFRERVAASIAVEQFIVLSGTRGVTISGRRDLGRPDAPLAWHSSLGRGLNRTDPVVLAAADAALQRVRDEYE